MNVYTVQLSTNSDDIRLYVVEANDPTGAESYARRIAEEHDSVGSSWTVDMTFIGVARPVSKGAWVQVIDLRLGGGFKREPAGVELLGR